MHFFSGIKILSAKLFLLLFCISLFSVCSVTYSQESGSDQEMLSEQIILIIKESAKLIDGGEFESAALILHDLENKNVTQIKEVNFLLGRTYRKAGDAEKAVQYFLRAAETYPLLRDYALKALSEIYIEKEEYQKAMEAAAGIENVLLLRDVKKIQIETLMLLSKYDEAIQAIIKYTKKYPGDQSYKMVLAGLLKEKGDVEGAVELFRKIYISAQPESAEALKALRALEADSLKRDELKARADNLYRMNRFPDAKVFYERALALYEGAEKYKIIFSVGLCQFRQKKYADSAKTFSLLGSPKSMYWHARSYYRINDMENFSRVKREFEKKYSRNKRLALLLLMEADELRRRGDQINASGIYKKLAESFPKSREDALWGLGWMSYNSGDPVKAFDYFSQLSTFTKSTEHQKYIYWTLKAFEKMKARCDEADTGDVQVNCADMDANLVLSPTDDSFYGYLIRMNYLSYGPDEKIQHKTASKPYGEQYDRIEALASLGMQNEAVSEINYAFKRIKSPDHYFYLASLAAELNSFKESLYIAESRKEKEYLPYSYPLGFWDSIQEASQRENIDAYLIAALIREESRFDPEAVSWAGAVGLMQLMPSTARRMNESLRIEFNGSQDLQVPSKNINLGAHYLSKLVNELRKPPLVLAAYNAGEKTLQKWMERFSSEDLIEFIENIPYQETRRYIKKVLNSYWQYRAINGLSIYGPEVVFTFPVSPEGKKECC